MIVLFSIYSCRSGAVHGSFACTSVFCGDSRHFTGHFVAIVAKVQCQQRVTARSRDLHACLAAAFSLLFFICCASLFALSSSGALTVKFTSSFGTLVFPSAKKKRKKSLGQLPPPLSTHVTVRRGGKGDDRDRV